MPAKTAIGREETQTILHYILIQNATLINVCFLPLRYLLSQIENASHKIYSFVRSSCKKKQNKNIVTLWPVSRGRSPHPGVGHILCYGTILPLAADPQRDQTMSSLKSIILLKYKQTYIRVTM